MKTISTIIIFLIPFLVAAQMNFQFLPISENGKLGFINISGNQIVAPQFDAYTAHIHSKRRTVFNYLIVEKDNKLGVLDTNGTLVLPTIYEDVELLDILPLQFKVRTKEGVFPIDSAGTPLINKKYDDVSLITDRYYAVKKGENWGIHESNGKQILSCKYYGFQIAKDISKQYVNGYFIYKANKKGTQNGLLSLDGKTILPPIYNTINFINDEVVSASWKKSNFKLYTILGDSSKVSFKKARPLMRDFIVLTKAKGKKSLFNLQTFKELKFEDNYKEYSYLSKKYIRVLKGRWNVVDTTGNVLLNQGYDTISVFTDNLFLTKKYKRGKWSITGINDTIILNAKYDLITQLNMDGFSKIFKNKKQGLINAKGAIILPAEYDRIEKESGQYRGYNGRSVSFFNPTSDGKLVFEKKAKNVRTIRAGYTDKAKNQPAGWNSVPNSNFRFGRNNLSLKFDGRQQGFEEISSRTTILESKYYLIYRLPNSNLSLVYSHTSDEPKEFFKDWITISIYDKIQVFQEKEQRFLEEEEEILGIRGEDFKTGKYAAYVRKDGSFGLIDRDGRISKKDGKPMRFTYILPFKEGYARVYLNGEMSIPRFEMNRDMNVVADSWSLCKDFGINIGANVRKYNLMVKGDNWTYLDTTLTPIAPPTFKYAQDFENGVAICYTSTGCGMINPQMDTLLNFKYSSVQPLKSFRNDSFYLISIVNQEPILFNKKGEELNSVKEYDKIYDYKNGFGRVKIGDTWGFINEDFEEVIPCQFQLVRPFNDGWAAVRQDNQWHFIDTLGEIKMSINENIRDVGEFHNGMNWFRVGNKYGFISKEKPIAIPPRFTKVSDFINGIAVAESKGGYGIINQNGDFVLKPSLKMIGDFNENGIAIYQRADSKLFGLIDEMGNFLTEPKFDIIGKFHNGYAKVSRNYLFGLIDLNGKIIVPLKYEQIGEYYENLLAVKVRYKDWQYIDITGKVKIKGDFYNAYRFQNGIAKVFVLKNRTPKEHYIDTKGNFLFKDFAKENDYDKIIFFEESIRGCSALRYSAQQTVTGTDYYFLDSLDNQLGKKFKTIEPFQNGLAIVETHSRTYGVIDKKGFYAIEPKYRKIFRQPNGQFKAIATTHYGIIAKDGTFVHPVEYDRIRPIIIQVSMFGQYKYIFKLEHGDTIEYLSENGDWLWKK